jgi:hypothetical protein
MRVRFVSIAAALAFIGSGFAGGSSVGAAAPAPAPASAPVQVADDFHLRTTAPCLLKGRATSCTIDVTKLKRTTFGVVAHGTVTPAGADAVRFASPVVDFKPHVADGTVGIQQATCDILNLVLGPLHLDLLGLVVDLNEVVLDITGETGAGNLLGNLLCGLFGILDAPAGITEFLRVLDGLLATINELLRL